MNPVLSRIATLGGDCLAEPKDRLVCVCPTDGTTIINGLLCRGYGAKVIVKGAQWSEANAEAEHLAQSTGGVLIHPFDQPDLWAGHATVVHEVSNTHMSHQW